jgi:hypothetical protein
MKNERFKLKAALTTVFLLGAALLVMHVAFPTRAVFATAPTSIADQVPLGPYQTTVGSGALAITFTAADTTNGNSFPMTGHEVLIVYNTDSSAHTITINSVADQLGRTNDITSYSVAATSHAAFNFRNGITGWQQPSDLTVHLQANSADIEFAILQLP